MKVPRRWLQAGYQRAILGMILVLATAVLTSIGAVSPARATVGSPDYPDTAPLHLASSALDSVTDPWGFFNRECTSFVAWRLNNDNGVAFSNNMKGPNNNTGHFGDASNWASNAAYIGYTVNSTPAVGSIAVWPSSVGHVGYVDAVNTDGTINTEEYNWISGYGWDTTTQKYDIPIFDGAYHKQMSYNWSANSVQFIHIKDLAASGVGTRLLADVNGDGKADAVVMFRDTGIAMVATSSGSSFSSPVAWSNEPQMAGATHYFLGDVNGDGKADLIGFWNTGGVWKVMLSTGSGFQGPPTTFATSQGINTTKQWIADVNGDGKADMVTFDAATGDWYASISTGSGFGPNQVLWSHGNGVGSNDQVVADFNGDGKADLGVYFAVNGSWYVTLSGATPPFSYSQWSSGHGMSSNQRLVGDVNGGGKADEAFFFNNGHWDNGMSTGTGFLAPTPWADGQGVGTTERFLADVNGDGMADLVTFDDAQGDWNVDLSSGSGFWPPVLWIHGHGAGS